MQDFIAEAARAHFMPERDVALCMLYAGTGLRVSEAVRIDVDHIERRGAYPSVTVLRKGGMEHEVALPYPVFIALEECRGGREFGPMFVTKSGNRCTRNDAYWIVRNTAQRAGLNTKGWVHPHSLRHSWCTIALDHGVHPRDLMHSGAWKSMRMVEHYDRNRTSLARSANHTVAAAISAA